MSLCWEKWDPPPPTKKRQEMWGWLKYDDYIKNEKIKKEEERAKVRYLWVSREGRGFLHIDSSIVDP